MDIEYKPMSGRVQQLQLGFPSLMIAGGAAICGWMLILLGAYPVGLQPLLLAFFVIAMVLRAPIGIYAFVAIVLVYPLLSNNTPWVDTVRLSDVLFGIALLGFVTFSVRYLDLRREFHLVGDLWDISIDDQRDARTIILRPMAGRWINPVIAISLALILLLAFPLDDTSIQTVGLSAPIARALSIVWFLVLAWLLLATTFSLVSWRRINNAQAGIYVRSALATEFGRELASIERRRARSLRKKT